MPEAPWRARLALAFARDGARTTLARRAHEGPLVVQRPLYPEGDGVCQCIVVHPPGGIAGGDELTLDIEVEAGAHAQLTTPGAAKWYRGAGRTALQQTHFRVAEGGVLEWMPFGTIVFDGADATSTYTIELAREAVFIGFDVICLGRTASTERFLHGRWRQRIDIVRGDALVWSERMRLRGDSALLQSPVGLYGAPVFGTFVAMGANIDHEFLTACREIKPVAGDGAVTRLPDALVARYRGEASEAAHDYFAALWTRVRPRLTGRSAVPLRIWRT